MKKVAQLTKVVFYMNTRRDQTEERLRLLRALQEDEVRFFPSVMPLCRRPGGRPSAFVVTGLAVS